MKGKTSIISGLLIGLLISYFILDYRESSTSHLGVDGKVLNKITELDFSFINNAFIIIVITSGIIYYLLVKLEKSEQKRNKSRN
jgi:heme/copper-type cytochrome/quinol oxidase subunit 2